MNIYRQSAHFLKNSTQTTRFLVTSALLAILIGCWYIFLFSPLSAALAFYRTQNETLETKKSRLSRIMKANEQIIHDVKDLEKRVENIIRNFCDDVHIVLEKILTSFKKYSLSVDACKIGKIENCENTPFNAAGCECSIQGKYENIVKAMDDLESLYPAVSCVHGELRKSESGCAGLLRIHIFLVSPYKAGKTA